MGNLEETIALLIMLQQELPKGECRDRLLVVVCRYDEEFQCPMS